MGLRQTLNENPMITTVLTVVIMVGALVYIVTRFVGHSGPAHKADTKSYFSDDDGKTWFLDDATNIPPFDHNGKQAYKAYLFRCKDQPAFVARLEGFDADAKAKIQADIKGGKPAPTAEFMYQGQGMMIKRPGEKNWLQLHPGDSQSLEEWGKVMSPRCPDGSPFFRPVSVDENAQP